MMKTSKRNLGVIWAIVLILTGLVILLSSLKVIDIKEDIYFYVAIGIIGIIFHIICFIGNPKKYYFLVPGGMLLILSALLISCEYSDNLTLNNLWSVIILAVAFGMLEQRVFSKGEQGNWASIIVVSTIGFFFLIKNNLNFGIVFGTLLIIVGLLIVIRITRRLPKEEDVPKEEIPEEIPETDSEFDEL